MDKLPLYDGSGSPRDWLLENQINLSKYIDVNDCLDIDDKIVCRDFVDSNAIYKNLGIHIYQFLKVHDEWKLRVLKHHMASWMSLDELTCIGSHQAITDFLQSLLEWRETLHLRKIVALDIDALCARLFNIIHTQSRYRALSNLKDYKAQEMLNLMQNLLDCPTLAICFRNTFVGGLLRLSGKSGLVPEALIRQDVTLEMGDAVAAGAFGELYTGDFRGQAVAVKVFKFYQNTDMATYLKAISRETLIWRQLFHPHVLPFICVHYYSTNIHQRIGLVSPWMKHGNVQEFLRQFPDANRTSLITDVAEGLFYLHSTHPIVTIVGEQPGGWHLNFSIKMKKPMYLPTP
ncbi:hypothetical protein BDZ94DRAFT_1324733 [Collybia nuda]|uniref:Protein kinase domain-containing protein n=1 Tax=Collybia nuda TaxID=64659 RepID=A0A9P6CBG1_9AGAR|nr:hypothetical protein BDZ94DRAFT_1324733 [Collybia nuda]